MDVAGTEQRSSPANGDIPPAIQTYLGRLPTLPEKDAPAWQRIRELDIKMHSFQRATREEWEEYRMMWKLRYDSELKAKLPEVVCFALDPNFQPQVRAPLSGENIDLMKVKNELQGCVRDGNVAALSLIAKMFTEDAKKRLGEISEKLKEPVGTFEERRSLIGQENEFLRRWRIGMDVETALGHKFGLFPIVWEDITKSPNLNTALELRIRIPSRE